MSKCPTCGEPLLRSKYLNNRRHVCEQPDCKRPCCDCCSEVYADGKRYCRQCTHEE